MRPFPLSKGGWVREDANVVCSSKGTAYVGQPFGEGYEATGWGFVVNVSSDSRKKDKNVGDWSEVRRTANY